MENVQFKLESMIPALQDLEERKIFTKPELKMIVKKRRDFECAIQRRTTQLIDYMAYIQYEMTLETLRRRRCAKKIAENADDSNTTKLSQPKKAISERAGISQIHQLFRKATKKFPGDLDLWRAWIQFCKKSKSASILARTYPACLSMHPRAESVWIEAADWEWSEGGNVDAARNLMLRALRFVGDKEIVWIAYFRLEMLFLAKIIGRREHLGIAEETPQPNLVSTEALPEAEKDSEVTETDYSQLTDTKEFMAGALPAIVVKNALSTIKSDTIHDAFIDAYMELWVAHPSLAPVCEKGLETVRAMIEEQ